MKGAKFHLGGSTYFTGRADRDLIGRTTLRTALKKDSIAINGREYGREQQGEHIVS